MIDVSGQGAGSVFIRCGKFVSDDSAIYAKTYGDTDGGRIDIQADSISFENGSEINGNNYGSGKGADVILSASGPLTFSGSDEAENASRFYLEHTAKPKMPEIPESLTSAQRIFFFRTGHIFQAAHSEAETAEN